MDRGDVALIELELWGLEEDQKKAAIEAERLRNQVSAKRVELGRAYRELKEQEQNRV